MAYCNRLILIAAAVALVGMMELGQGPAQAQAQLCSGLDISGLITQCGRYVGKSGPKIPPSEECCGVVEKIDLPCACKYVSKDVEKLVSVDKAVYVARCCGVPLKPGFKCGSYTVPLALDRLLESNGKFDGCRIREEGGNVFICWQDRPLYSISSWRFRRY